MTTTPQSCVNNAGCGWCGDKNTCIPGTPSGPLAPCMRNTFLYTAPTPEWNPFRAGTINILAVDPKGRPQLNLTPNPDMSRINVWNPYR
jgi:hypothetical protein